MCLKRVVIFCKGFLLVRGLTTIKESLILLRRIFDHFQQSLIHLGEVIQLRKGFLDQFLEIWNLPLYSLLVVLLLIYCFFFEHNFFVQLQKNVLLLVFFLLLLFDLFFQSLVLFLQFVDISFFLHNFFVFSLDHFLQGVIIQSYSLNLSS